LGTLSGLSVRARLWLGVIAIGLLLWCFFAWLVLERPFLDAAGESVGTALLLGVLASVIGAVRGSRPNA
jgi:hypothetical protein